MKNPPLPGRQPGRTPVSPLVDRMQKGNLMAATCPSREVLRHVTSKWGVLALLVLEGGTHRFAELRRQIEGVSERMLAQTLQALESDGLVRRVAYEVVPPHVEYSLTPLGAQAAQRVRVLADWIETNLFAILDARGAREAAQVG